MGLLEAKPYSPSWPAVLKLVRFRGGHRLVGGVRRDLLVQAAGLGLGHGFYVTATQQGVTSLVYVKRSCIFICSSEL